MFSSLKQTVLQGIGIFCLIVGFQVLFPADVIRAQAISDDSDVLRLYERTQDGSDVPVITCLDIEPSGRLLAIGGDDHIVRIWDLEAKRFVLDLREHLDWVRGLAFSPDRSRLAAVGQDGQINIWNVNDGKLIRSIKDPVRGTQQIVFNPDGSKFAVSGHDAAVRIYETTVAGSAETLTAHGTSNRAITYSRDGSLLAVGGRTGVVRIWKTDDSSRFVDIQGDGRRVNAVAFNSRGDTIAVAGDGPFITLWNPMTGQLLKRLAERPGKTFSLAFCGDDLLASGESDNAIRLWDLRRQINSATFIGHTGTISSMVFEPSKGILVSGSFDTSIRFWTIGNEPGSEDAPLSESFPATTALETVPENQSPAPVSTVPTFATPAFPTTL